MDDRKGGERLFMISEQANLKRRKLQKSCADQCNIPRTFQKMFGYWFISSSREMMKNIFDFLKICKFLGVLTSEKFLIANYVKTFTKMWDPSQGFFYKKGQYFQMTWITFSKKTCRQISIFSSMKAMAFPRNWDIEQCLAV